MKEHCKDFSVFFTWASKSLGKAVEKEAAVVPVFFTEVAVELTLSLIPFLADSNLAYTGITVY